MNQKNFLISLLVRDYDEASRFFVDRMDFRLLEARYIAEQDNRWVVATPAGDSDCKLLLAQASSEQQAQRIGDQTGGRVGFFMHTDDFWRDYQAYSARGIEFTRPPRQEVYGTVAVFRDLYGNLWDLLQPA